ncbi:hypothetical protein COCOBI_05-5690 [Coccomyxa sp. Obi]|nr:hypothetical protein COCOBI_05-5690 [Coccomyxa sp. Obi]
MSKTGRSHLLRHTLPDIDVAEHFGTTDGKEIAKEIARMGQKELQAKFKMVYGAPTFSNNNNWLRRKLMEAAGLQTPKVLGTGQTSPRKHSHNLGDPGIDGGAFERLQGGIRRTKRQRKPKQYEDMMLGEGLDGDFMHSKAGQRSNSNRAPLSIGDAYLQHQNAAYQASLGWQDTGDFLISPHLLGKHQYGGMGGAFGLPGLSEVVWPGVQKRSLRDNESGSSSEDQTAYEGGHHSHYSHSTHSHEGPARSPRAADKLVREIQEAIALLGGAAGGAAGGSAAAGSFHGGSGRSGLADLGFPAFEPHDLAVPAGGAAAHLWNFGSADRAGEPRSTYMMMGGPRGNGGGGGPPSPPLNLQGFLRSSGMGEHVGGNTPILEDFSYPLVNSPALLSGLGADALEMSQQLPSLDAPGGSRERRSPSLGADLAALFPTLGSLEGRQLISQLGSGPANSDRDNTPQPSAASSLDRILSDLGSSDALQEHKIASVPTAPAKSPRGHANMEGAAAPSMRFAGVPLLPMSAVASPPRFQPAGPPKEAGPEPLPSQAPAPDLAPSELTPNQESADGPASRLTSVASLASWSRAQLQEQAAAAAEAAGTADDPVVLEEGPNTTDGPAIPSATAGPAVEALQCPEGPMLGQQCGAVEISRQDASGVIDQGEQRMAEVADPEAPGSEKGKEEAASLPEPVDPFTFLQ